jgi:hypothetical protein
MSNEKLQKPIDHDPSHSGLEPYRPALRGVGTVARCQARSRTTGTQCNGIARAGFSVCWKHGAGSRKRELEGRAKRAGRPLTTGIYSVRQAALVQEMLEQAPEVEHDLDNTDREITLARVLLANVLILQPDVDELSEALRRAIDDHQYDPMQLLQAGKLYARLERWLQSVSDLNLAVVRIAKYRADMVERTAQARALSQFIEWTQALRVVLTESLTPEQYRAVFERIKREVLGPLGAPKALNEKN